MNASKYLIALGLAVLITAVEFAGLSLLADNAARSARRVAVPQAAIPMLPEIRVRPTHEEVRAAFAATDVASVAHPNYAVLFYSFAVKPTAANKG